MTTEAAAPNAPTTPAVPDTNAPAAPAVPAAAPVAPGATPGALDVSTPEAPKEPEAVVYTYDSTGDSGFDIGLKFVGEVGIGPDTPEMQAAFKGDFTALEAKLKGMGDKAAGYAPYLTAAKDAYARNVEKGQATIQAVYTAVGGQEQWATLQAWVQKTADLGEKQYINNAFKAGGAIAAKVAKEINDAYLAAGNTLAKPKQAVKEGASGTPGGNAEDEALSPVAYRAAIAELTKKFGAGAFRQPEYAALTARRKAYRG